MNNTKKQVIEFAPFTLADGVDNASLWAASDTLQAEFLSQQPGFVKRDLLKSADGKWVDVIYWESMESVEQAMQNAPGNPAALKYFQLMSSSEQDDPSANMLLLSVARTYS